MLYWLLFLFLGIPLLFIVGIIYAFKKLSFKKFALLIFLLISLPYAAFKLWERNFMLSVIPDALQVHSISYRKEESWGFGPGGNEAGIRIYPLSDELSKEIESRGIEFFKAMPPNINQQSRDWRGRYEDWEATPIQIGSHWKPNTENPKKDSKRLDIYDYICAYGFCIDIDPVIVEKANSIVNSDGSYYAYGRIGLLIVSPKNKIILYLYNG